jgi:hypothetical protein
MDLKALQEEPNPFAVTGAHGFPHVQIGQAVGGRPEKVNEHQVAHVIAMQVSQEYFVHL